jgi:hypothetical protein
MTKPKQIHEIKKINKKPPEQISSNKEIDGKLDGIFQVLISTNLDSPIKIRICFLPNSRVNRLEIVRPIFPCRFTTEFSSNLCDCLFCHVPRQSAKNRKEF